nr:uncharacterized protein LOC111425793 [Onthophagus taurus]
MSVSPLLRPLGIVAAILGTLQGLTWTVLSLLVILLSSQAWKPELSNFYNFNLIAYALFFLERDSNGSSESDLIFTGTTVLVFGCLYLVISFIWAVSSMTLTWIFMREKYENARISCKSWSVITIITTILDFILIIILAIDLEKYSLKEEDDYTVASMKYVYGTVVGIAMTIAARGFVLLIINPILAIYLLKYSKEVSPSPYFNVEHKIKSLVKGDHEMWPNDYNDIFWCNNRYLSWRLRHRSSQKLKILKKVKSSRLRFYMCSILITTRKPSTDFEEQYLIRKLNPWPIRKWKCPVRNLCRIPLKH